MYFPCYLWEQMSMLCKTGILNTKYMNADAIESYLKWWQKLPQFLQMFGWTHQFESASLLVQHKNDAGQTSSPVPTAFSPLLISVRRFALHTSDFARARWLNTHSTAESRTAGSTVGFDLMTWRDHSVDSAKDNLLAGSRSQYHLPKFTTYWPLFKVLTGKNV